jgi:hypothetical protein
VPPGGQPQSPAGEPAPEAPPQAPGGVPDSLAQAPASAAPDSSETDTAIREILPADVPALPRPFGIGESLKFSIQYGPIKAGTGILTVEGVERVGDQDCLRLVSTAQSNPVFSPFYKVRDKVESLVDVRHLLTRRTRKALNEKDYRLDQTIEWDQEQGKLTYEDGTTLDVVPGERDVLGAFYYVRTLPLEVGVSVPIQTHDNKKSYPLMIHVLGEETIDTPLGRFDCLVVEPKLQSDGLFRRSGSLKVWLTRDHRRLPVMMQSSVKVGAISAVLIEVRHGNRSEPTFGLNVN